MNAAVRKRVLRFAGVGEHRLGLGFGTFINSVGLISFLFG
jgi:hypothetical protein